MTKTISIDNLPSETCERAEAVKRALQGKTYLNLQVRFAPAGGSFEVLVESGSARTEKELRGMVMSLLISNLR